MNSRQLARVLTVLLLGVGGGWDTYHRGAVLRKPGLNAYLARQTIFFAKPPLLLTVTAMSIFGVLLILWVYEGFFWLLQKYWKQSDI